MRVAVRAARNSTSRMKHGAVVHRGGRLLAVGWNRSRVQDRWLTTQPRSSCTVHAEIAALRGVNAVGATVLVIRLHRDGTLADSRPCDGCWDALDAAGVRKVVFS